jgi:hypothetical protein
MSSGIDSKLPSVEGLSLGQTCPVNTGTGRWDDKGGAFAMNGVSTDLSRPCCAPHPLEAVTRCATLGIYGARLAQRQPFDTWQLAIDP